MTARGGHVGPWETGTPLFYFDFWNGQKLMSDDDGVDLRGLEIAFEIAIRMARNIMADAQRRGQDASEWSYVVTDESRKTLFTLPFSVAAVDKHYVKA
jgi:hypothetical protein